MIRKLPRLQDGTPGAEGTGSPAADATLLTSGATPTPAATSTVPAEGATPVVPAVDATQQTSADPAATTLTPEAQAAADAAKAAADKAATEVKAAEKVVPEKYELKAPEGVTLEPEALGELEGIAKEFKLSQEEAQKVTDIGVKMIQRQQAAMETQVSAWIADSKADKEFGGDKLTENLAIGEKALTTFGTPALQALLKESRLSNHPEVIRFMVRAGKAISEDRMVTGGAGPAGGAAPSTAKALYPNQS
jgi:hypothetical protein